MELIQTLAPAVEPLTLAEAKLHLRVEVTDDDVLIAQLIRAARQACEAYTNRTLVATIYELTLDAFPGEIRLPRPPLVEVSSISYVDASGVDQTLGTDVYTVDKASFMPRVYEAYNEWWPGTRSQPKAVTVTYIAGYACRFTAEPATEVVTVTSRTLTNGEFLFVSNIGGALPAGLSVGTTYYIVEKSGATCKLSLTLGGSGVDITDAGSGTHFIGEIPEAFRAAMKLFIGHWYANREGVIVGQTATPLPQAAEWLLYPYRVLEA